MSDSETPRDGTEPNVASTQSLGSDYQLQLQALLQGTSPEEADAINALPSGSALMIVRRGPNVGSRFLLDNDETIAGRHPEADIFLDDVTVSRRHAKFVRSGTTFSVEDLQSLNGTYFNGDRVDSATLVDGAEVQVGKFRLTFYSSRHDILAAAS